MFYDNHELLYKKFDTFSDMSVGGDSAGALTDGMMTLPEFVNLIELARSEGQNRPKSYLSHYSWGGTPRKSYQGDSIWASRVDHSEKAHCQIESTPRKKCQPGGRLHRFS